MGRQHKKCPEWTARFKRDMEDDIFFDVYASIYRFTSFYPMFLSFY